MRKMKMTDDEGIEINLEELKEPRDIRHIMKSFDHPKKEDLKWN